MARTRFNRNSSVVRSSIRRQSDWFFIAPAITVMTGAGGTLISSLNASALALRPFTIVRSRLELYLISDQQVASEPQGAAFGMAVVSDQAVAVGITAIPTPITDLGSDLWFVHQPMWNATTFQSAVGGYN